MVVVVALLMSEATLDGLVDDSVDVAGMYSTATTTPMMCFRVIHREAKRRKTHISATNELRTDMLAIALYEISSRNRAERTLHVTSQMNDADGQIHLLGYDEFLRIGMGKLRSAIIASELSSEASFHFEGGAYLLTDLLTDLLTYYYYYYYY